MTVEGSAITKALHKKSKLQGCAQESSNAESVGQCQPRVCFETLGGKMPGEIVRNRHGSWPRQLHAAERNRLATHDVIHEPRPGISTFVVRERVLERNLTAAVQEDKWYLFADTHRMPKALGTSPPPPVESSHKQV